MVGEVSALIADGGGANGDSLLSSSRRVVARVTVVVAGGDSEVHTSVNGLVDGVVERPRLASTERHVRDGTLVRGLASLLELLEGGLRLRLRLSSSPDDTTDDIAHGTAAVAAEDLDGNDVRSLGDTVLARSDRASAVGTVAVAILIDVVLRNGLAPERATLELDMVDVDAGVDDVNIDALATSRVVLVLGERAECKLRPVTDTSEALEEMVSIRV